MRRTFIVSIIMLAAAVAVAAGIAALPAETVKAADIQINETTFPDEYFRNWVTSQSYGQDLVLTAEEIADVKKMYVTPTINNNQITNYKGIEYFTEVTNLYIAGKPTSLNVRKNTKLKYLSAENLNMSTLDLSQNPLLVELNVRDGQLTRLDLSHNNELVTFFCWNNKLTSLDVSNCKKLKNFQCYSNQITELKVGDNTALVNLFCYNNPITSLDVSNNTNLEDLRCSDTQISSLDLRNNKALTRIICENTPLTSLDLSENLALSQLDIDNTLLTELNVKKNTALRNLSCQGSQLTSLNLSNNTALTFLYCNLSSKLEKIDLGNITSLEYLYCHDCCLKSLDLSKCKDLKDLNCKSNMLTKLDMSGYAQLNHLYCANNQLTDLNIKGCTSLTELDCSKNQLKSIDLSTNKVLEKIVATDNKIAEIGLGENTALKHVDLRRNELVKIDVSNNTEITDLYLSENKLAGLDVSKNVSLYNLDCSNNQLTGLDLRYNTNITILRCEFNKLNSLDVSENETLRSLYCADNQFKKVYVHDKMHYVKCGDAVKVILTPADWKYTGAEWKADNKDPSKTAAFAKFQCIKEGEEDYTCSREMKVKVLSFPENICTVGGKVEYEAKLAESRSRTKNAISEKKKFNMPAAGHSWGSWKSTKNASVGAAAVDTRTCSVCKTKETRNPEAIVICGRNLTLTDTFKGESSVSWKSSNSKIATVDSKGKITSKMAGKVTISATASGRTEKCVVTVLYKDVTNTDDFWYAPTNYLTAKGVVKGYANQTEFRPANDCTRAQMVTFLYRLQGEPKTKSNKCKFDDVKSGDYFYKPVIWAVEQGITTGVSENKFAPQKVCTRAQTVTFLWRMAGKPEPGKNAKTFSDVNKKDYFYKATLWASDMKILAGYDDGTFRPQGKCLRRQMVTFLYKYDKFVNNR